MKKALIASAFFCLASVSQAAFINCSPPQSTVVDTSGGLTQTFTCNPGGNNIAGDGLTITDFKLRLSGTFQESAAIDGLTYSVKFTTNNVSNPAAVGVLTCTASGAEGVSPALEGQALGACSTVSSTFAIAGNPDFIPTFQVDVTGAPGSIPLPYNASASVAYEVSTVPEPATYAMMGIGLVGALLARRRA